MLSSYRVLYAFNIDCVRHRVEHFFPVCKRTHASADAVQLVARCFNIEKILEFARVARYSLQQVRVGKKGLKK